MQLENKQPENIFKVFFFSYYRPIFVVVAVLILVAGYLLLLRGSIINYQSNYKSAKDLRAGIVAGQAQLAKAKEVAGKLYQPTAEDRKLFDMVLADKPDQSALIEHFTIMAKQAGFEVASIDLGDVKNAALDGRNLTNVGRITVRLTLAGGGYDELKKMIALAEASVMQTEIATISYSPQSPNIEMSLIVYYYNENGYGQQ